MRQVPMNSRSRPLLGILTIEDEDRLFRGNRKNFIDIIKTGKKMGVPVYVITTKDLTPHTRQILAYEYIESTQRWKAKWIRIPHVIYNRIPEREDEMQADIKQKIEQCLHRPQLHFYNSAFFNKGTLFKWLQQSDKTKKWVPQTKRLKQAKDLRQWLHRYSFLYLKPEKGKAGKGIMCIRKNILKRKRYQLFIQSERTLSRHSYATMKELYEKIERRISKHAYIAQQGIELAQSKKRPYDLRLLVQKNKAGLWKISGIGARIAGVSSITTHVPRGGSIGDPRKLLIESFGKRRTKIILTRVRSAALIIVKHIERCNGYPLGEMSLDIGVDKKGQIWFFEANSKPMKFDEPQIRTKSLQRLIEYSSYLSKRSNLDRGDPVL